MHSLGVNPEPIALMIVVQEVMDDKFYLHNSLSGLVYIHDILMIV